jgi:hypothetical protein
VDYSESQAYPEMSDARQTPLVDYSESQAYPEMSNTRQTPLVDYSESQAYPEMSDARQTPLVDYSKSQEYPEMSDAQQAPLVDYSESQEYPEMSDAQQTPFVDANNPTPSMAPMSMGDELTPSEPPQNPRQRSRWDADTRQASLANNSDLSPMSMGDEPTPSEPPQNPRQRSRWDADTRQASLANNSDLSPMSMGDEPNPKYREPVALRQRSKTPWEKGKAPSLRLTSMSEASASDPDSSPPPSPPPPPRRRSRRGRHVREEPQREDASDSATERRLIRAQRQLKRVKVALDNLDKTSEANLVRLEKADIELQKKIPNVRVQRAQESLEFQFEDIAAEVTQIKEGVQELLESNESKVISIASVKGQRRFLLKRIDRTLKQLREVQTGTLVPMVKDDQKNKADLKSVKKSVLILVKNAKKLQASFSAVKSDTKRELVLVHGAIAKLRGSVTPQKWKELNSEYQSLQRRQGRLGAPFDEFVEPLDELEAAETGIKTVHDEVTNSTRQFKNMETELRRYRSMADKLDARKKRRNKDKGDVPQGQGDVAGAFQSDCATITARPSVPIWIIRPIPVVKLMRTRSIAECQRIVGAAFSAFHQPAPVPGLANTACTDQKEGYLSNAQKFGYHYANPFQTDVGGVLFNWSAGAGKSWLIALIASTFMRAGWRVLIGTREKLRTELLGAMFNKRADWNVQNAVVGCGIRLTEKNLERSSQKGRAAMAKARGEDVDSEEDEEDEVKEEGFGGFQRLRASGRGGSRRKAGVKEVDIEFGESEKENRSAAEYLDELTLGSIGEDVDLEEDEEDSLIASPDLSEADKAERAKEEEKAQVIGVQALLKMGARLIFRTSTLGNGINSFQTALNILADGISGRGTLYDSKNLLPGEEKLDPFFRLCIILDESQLMFSRTVKMRAMGGQGGVYMLMLALFKSRKVLKRKDWPMVIFTTATPNSTSPSDGIMQLNMTVEEERAWYDFYVDGDPDATTRNFLRDYVEEDGSLNDPGLKRWNKLAKGNLSYVNMYGDRLRFPQPEYFIERVRLSDEQSSVILKAIGYQEDKRGKMTKVGRKRHRITAAGREQDNAARIDAEVGAGWMSLQEWQRDFDQQKDHIVRTRGGAGRRVVAGGGGGGGGGDSDTDVGFYSGSGSGSDSGSDIGPGSGSDSGSGSGRLRAGSARVSRRRKQPASRSRRKQPAAASRRKQPAAASRRKQPKSTEGTESSQPEVDYTKGVGLAIKSTVTLAASKSKLSFKERIPNIYRFINKIRDMHKANIKTSLEAASGIAVGEFRGMGEKMMMYVPTSDQYSFKTIEERLEKSKFFILNPGGKGWRDAPPEKEYWGVIIFRGSAPGNLKTANPELAEFDGQPLSGSEGMLRKIFNSKANRDGRIATLIVISSEYREGISLLGIQSIWVAGMEQSRAFLVQAIHRAIRFCSARDLPFEANKGWTVKVYLQTLYWSKKYAKKVETKLQKVSAAIRDANPHGPKFFKSLEYMDKLFSMSGVDQELFAGLNQLEKGENENGGQSLVADFFNAL